MRAGKPRASSSASSRLNILAVNAAKSSSFKSLPSESGFVDVSPAGVVWELLTCLRNEERLELSVDEEARFTPELLYLCAHGRYLPGKFGAKQFAKNASHFQLVRTRYNSAFPLIDQKQVGGGRSRKGNCFRLACIQNLAKLFRAVRTRQGLNYQPPCFVRGTNRLPCCKMTQRPEFVGNGGRDEHLTISVAQEREPSNNREIGDWRGITNHAHGPNLPELLPSYSLARSPAQLAPLQRRNDPSPPCVHPVPALAIGARSNGRRARSSCDAPSRLVRMAADVLNLRRVPT